MAGTRTWADGDVPSASDFNGYFRDQVVTICTSGTRPTTSQNGRLIFETDTNRYYRWSTALSAWVHILGGSVTWSNPTTGVTIGNGTWAGSYTRSGDLVIVSGKLTWGSTTSISGTIGLTLPISVIGAFTAVWAAGFTLNQLTLMALTLAIGLLIDDAIVVRENIVRHSEMGKDHVRAAREGTDEIGLAVLATTLSIVEIGRAHV